MKTALLPRLRRLTTAEQWRRLSLGMALGTVTGALSGLALLGLLPASVALATGEPSWGLRLRGWVVVLAVIAVVGAVTDFIGSRAGYLGSLGFMQQMHHSIGDKVASLPLSWFDASSAGKLSRTVSQEMMSLAQAAAAFMHKMRSASTACIVVAIGSWLWDWRLGLLLCLAAPMVALALWAARHCQQRAKAINEPAEQELAARIVEFARCQGALRACQISRPAALQRAFDQGRASAQRAFWWDTAGLVIGGAAAQLVVVLMIVLSAALALAGSMAPLEAVVTVGLSLRFITMVSEIGIQQAGAQERSAMMDQIDHILDAEALVEPDRSPQLPAPGAVQLSHVSFAYRTDAPVLRDVSLNVPPSSMCAIVGPSGSGKTTIARLIARFYDATSGEVLVGGLNVRQLTIADLMSQLSLVFQDVYLFDDTLEANIQLGRPTATADQVREAAELAGVTEIVERLPAGWQTRVGEGGRALSGGERQRVSIARALLKQAPIVLFDEATSALDAENEANIVAAMERLRRTSTLIVIAHKLETVAAADQVIVLDPDGRVAQQGHHRDLVLTDGPYKQFWDYRRSASGWSLV